MNKNQFLDHQEQMEALRREFSKFWNESGRIQLIGLNVPQQQYPAFEHIAWAAFQAGEKQTNRSQYKD